MEKNLKKYVFLGLIGLLLFSSSLLLSGYSLLSKIDNADSQWLTFGITSMVGFNISFIFIAEAIKHRSVNAIKERSRKYVSKRRRKKDKSRSTHTSTGE